MCTLPALQSAAKVFFTQKQAIEQAFPDADRVEERIFVLKDAQQGSVEKTARTKVESKIHKFYVGRRGDEVLGYAYIDVHTVRTRPEAFLVLLDPSGRVAKLEVLAFHEPLDYLPVDRWFRQFIGKKAGDPLRLNREVHGITGATLSARAVTSSVRRILALCDVLIEPEVALAEPRAQSATQTAEVN